MKCIEKIEVRKGDKVFYYTGEIKSYDADNVIIHTTRSETLIFRKSQIEGRQVISKGEETNGNEKSHKHAA